MDFFGDHIGAAAGLLLLFAIGLALAFEFVNGFHNTANAVATVIYTHSLKPTQAVVWSGLWNLTGVPFSSGAVAFGITALLPVELVLNVGSAAGFAMVFSLLVSAIVWNLGTWYFGLPASSSHTLIGSIMGVGLANSLLAKGHVFGEGVNWAKAKEVGMSLLISSLVGFCAAGALLLLAKALIKQNELDSNAANRALTAKLSGGGDFEVLSRADSEYALAWLLTMPVCFFLGAALVAIALNIIFCLGLR